MNDVLVSTDTATARTLTYQRLLWLMLFLWLGYVVGMSALVSHDMAAHPKAQAFADFMAQFIPMLDNIRKIPGSTEWVRFYYAVLWAVSPGFVYLGWLLRRQQCIEGKYLQKMSDAKLFFFWLGLLGFLAIALVWPVANGYSWRDQGVVSNIVGIAHYSAACFALVSGVGLYLRLSYSRYLYGSVIEPIAYSEVN